MMEFFKTLARGILVVLLSPLWLLYLGLFIGFILLRYVIFELLLVLNFFRGKNFIKEDKYALALNQFNKKMVESKTKVDAYNMQQQQMNIPQQSSSLSLTPPTYNQPIMNQSSAPTPQIVVIQPILDANQQPNLTMEQAAFIAKKALANNDLENTGAVIVNE